MTAATRALMFVLILRMVNVAKAQSCSDAEHRQFDFVVGNWVVSDPSGKTTGTVTITKEYSSCVLIEKWEGVGEAGESLGVAGYDPEKKSWHRDFIDGAGVVLALDGRWDGRSMVMTGKEYRVDFTQTHRVTWSAKADGTIEELWQISRDNGTSWQPQRDVFLRRISE